MVTGAAYAARVTHILHNPINMDTFKIFSFTFPIILFFFFFFLFFIAWTYPSSFCAFYDTIKVFSFF